MSTEKYLAYRGIPKAVACRDEHVFLITTHEENIHTPLYQLDLSTLQMSETALDFNASALLVSADRVWLGSASGDVYLQQKKIASLSKTGQCVTAMKLLSHNRLAVLIGDSVEVVDADSGKATQRIVLDEIATAIDCDSSGQWLAVGTAKGQVAVYEDEITEDKQKPTAFKLSETAKLHEGAVTAIMFDRDELRFLSAGNDNQLLTTHARGKLEAEDRGRGAGHDDAIKTMVQTSGERFITGAADRSCKSWLRSGATRPSTLGDSAGEVQDLAIASIHQRPHLVIASRDCLRIIALDAAGKFDHLSHRLFDAYAQAKHNLDSPQLKHRQDALKRLASYDDKKSLTLLGQEIRSESDHKLRLHIAEYLSASSHGAAQALLEACLNHKDEAIRLHAFTALQQRAVNGDVLRPLELALKTGKQELGKLAVLALEALAVDDDRALQRLIDALDATTFPVRITALASLENVKADEANIIAASCQQADIRRAALIRMAQRESLDQPRVQATLRRSLDDKNADVRQTAFLVSLFSRPGLLKAIRERDKNLHRLLFDIESFSLDPDAKPAGKEPAIRKTKFALAAIDYAPLVQATASLNIDSCLLGAHCLALLNDARAFGLLLQLSREDDKGARVRVCVALAALNDSRANQRLQTLLNDTAPEVRDAAYTALITIHEKTPQLAAELGLNTRFADVRRRALHSLVKMAKKQPPVSGDPLWQLLQLTINDSDSSVRAEAFKATLNMHLGGSHESALRFALHSTQASVRREVQTELIAEAGQSWAWSLLLELLNDADSSIRTETLAFTLKKTKGRDLTPVQSALQSDYQTTRLAAIEVLLKKPSEQAQALLLTAIDDDDPQVRKCVIDALVLNQAQSALQQALKSKHNDVVLQAACACARLGDSSALMPLIKVIEQAQPDNNDDAKRWQGNVKQALSGLEALASPKGVPAIALLLDNKNDGIRKQAAMALLWCCDSAQQHILQDAMAHEDKAVKLYATLGQSAQHDAQAMQMAIDQSHTTAQKRLCIGSMLDYDEQFIDRLSFMLDDEDGSISLAALVTLMMLEYKKPHTSPNHLLSILAASAPGYRLMAARAIENFDNPKAFGVILDELFNARHQNNWTIPTTILSTFADVIVFGDARLRCKTLQLLECLQDEKQDGWDLAWRAHSDRYASAISAAQKCAAKHKRPALKSARAELEMIAFGTYCGLVREQSAGKKTRLSIGDIIAIRQNALKRLSVLCENNIDWLVTAQPVFMQALGDPNQAVRLFALEVLQYFKVDPTLLSGECLETGHNDLGIKALEMLTQGESKKTGQQILQQAMLTRNDNLALEAAKLLLGVSDMLKVAKPALEAVNSAVRKAAVDWLSQDYENEKAQKLLHSALKSRYRDVTEYAAQALVVKQDSMALKVLVPALAQAAGSSQRRLIRSISQLGDVQGAIALLERIENDPAQNAEAQELFSAAGNFRDMALAPSLFKLFAHKPWRQGAFSALLKTSGFDQRINDAEDEHADRSWLTKQHPRHDALLQQLLEQCLDSGETDLLLKLIAGARWSQSDAVDAVLTTLCSHNDDAVRRNSVYAMGWRARKRQSTVAPVLAALQHRDPITQFWAAQNLAHAGNAQGVSILLSALDTLEDLKMRQCAVIALGELGDERALDSLLRLACDNEHALQEHAAEAIGHMAIDEEKSATIFALLKAFVDSERWGIQHYALRGLRYFNSREGWQLLREKAADVNYGFRETALKMLAFNDDQATGELLLQVLSSDGADVFDWGEDALNSAKTQFGADSLEPDYAFLCCKGEPADYAEDPLRAALERVFERGEAAHIFRILPECSAPVRTQLGMSLLKRAPLPLPEAALALESLNAEAVGVAATLLAYNPKKNTKAVCKKIETALTHWQSQWCSALAQQRKGHYIDDQATQHTLHRLIWASGATVCGIDTLLAMAASQDEDTKSMQLPAYQALADAGLKQADERINAVMAEALNHTDHRIRQLAANSIRQLADAKALAVLAQNVSDDKAVYQTLSAHIDAKAMSVARLSHSHRQALVLKQIIADKDVTALSNTAADATLTEAVRQSAIEALSQLGCAEGEGALLQLAGDETIDEDLRKMAWRCIRRSQRIRVKQEQRQQDKR